MKGNIVQAGSKIQDDPSPTKLLTKYFQNAKIKNSRVITPNSIKSHEDDQGWEMRNNLNPLTVFLLFHHKG